MELVRWSRHGEQRLLLAGSDIENRDIRFAEAKVPSLSVLFIRSSLRLLGFTNKRSKDKTSKGQRESNVCHRFAGPLFVIQVHKVPIMPCPAFTNLYIYISSKILKLYQQSNVFRNSGTFILNLTFSSTLSVFGWLFQPDQISNGTVHSQWQLRYRLWMWRQRTTHLDRKLRCGSDWRLQTQMALLRVEWGKSIEISYILEICIQ